MSKKRYVSVFRVRKWRSLFLELKFFYAKLCQCQFATYPTELANGCLNFFKTDKHVCLCCCIDNLLSREPEKMPHLRICITFACETSTLQGNDRETDVYILSMPILPCPAEMEWKIWVMVFFYIVLMTLWSNSWSFLSFGSSQLPCRLCNFFVCEFKRTNMHSIDFNLQIPNH